MAGGAVDAHTRAAVGVGKVVRERDHFGSDAFSAVGVRNHDAVDREIRPRAREPFAFNGGVRRLAPAADAEITGRISVRGEEPAVAALDVPPEVLLRGVAVLPLVQPLRSEKRLCLVRNACLLYTSDAADEL